MSTHRPDPPLVEIAPAQAGDLPALHALVTYYGLPTAGVDMHLGTMLVARDSQHLVGSAGPGMLRHRCSAPLCRGCPTSAR